ncbi:hypothetical protein J2751_002172 [Halorubrum alkaliphilum]|uniref:Uncharacterized protein n=1 Tax=Halorubrum alkaliphilum TaxID=261290 RepID=A0A8T4GF37_9EURY|nr:hypothetical protein [Halorubrum alkaliphilum]MBP1923134.1 hypothetical protein [Halorubrum alkaliphilum]
MFETNLDATYAWLGLAAVSIVTAGVVATLPASPPPDADGVAHTIDSVAGSDYVATAEHGVSADRLRITPRTVEIDGGGVVARSTIGESPITPVPPRGTGADDRLRRVLDGVSPETVFDDSGEFAAAAEHERTLEHEWRVAPDRITVKRVHYDETHVTLVG